MPNNNILQQVITYQKAGLAALQNQGPFISLSNKKFQNFQNLTANRGTTVSFDLPLRFRGVNSLIASFEPIEQRVHHLTVDKAHSIAVAYSAEQFEFNVKDYMQQIGVGAIAELGGEVERDIAQLAVTNTYRFFGTNAGGPLDDFGAVSRMLAFYRNYGAPRHGTKCILSDMITPSIVNSGLQQFVTNRNNVMANSWDIGSFSQCDFYSSNLLPVHNAGVIGNDKIALTVVTPVVSADGSISQITFSGAPASTLGAIKKNDKMQFKDGVVGHGNLRYLTFVNHSPSDCPVQIRATADADSDASGNITISFYPPLQSVATNSQNLNRPIVAGMQLEVMGDHRAGLLYAGDAMFVAMPRLPKQDPFPTANESDPETGASLRFCYGSRFGENKMGSIYDTIWGSTLVDEYAMSIILPLTYGK